MNPFRIALADLRVPAAPEESVDLACRAIAQAADERARILLLSGMLRAGLPGVREAGAPH